MTRDDLQRRFLAQHSVAVLEKCCNHSNVATMLQRCVALKIMVSCNITLLEKVWVLPQESNLQLGYWSRSSTTELWERFVGAKAFKLSSHSLCTSSILHLVNPKHFAKVFKRNWAKCLWKKKIWRGMEGANRVYHGSWANSELAGGFCWRLESFRSEFTANF